MYVCIYIYIYKYSIPFAIPPYGGVGGVLIDPYVNP